MRQLPSYSATSTKKELPVVECMDQGYVVTCVPKRPWPTNKTTAVPIRLRTDKNSCQYAYEYDPVAGIILPPERPYRWYHTTTYTDNNRANMHTIHRPTDSANMPAITTRRSHRTATWIWQLSRLYACDPSTNWSCRYAYDLPPTNRSCPCACDPTTNW
jgi:hypothetical protein